MKRRYRRVLVWVLALAMAAAVVPLRSGQAALQGVYFTAANEQLMELSSATMPFWSGTTLYVAGSLFQGGDLGVNYVKNSAMGLAVLYTTKTDLRFDLVNQKVYDKQGNAYEGRAIERRGTVFVPLDMVCRFFGLTWTYSETELAPLIRVTSGSALLDDSSFIDAATQQMTSRYEAYERLMEQQNGSGDEPGVYASDGQKVFLVIESTDAASTLAAAELLGQTQGTFLLTAEQMAQGDLVRALVAQGHAVALKATADGDAGQVADELEQGREALLRGAYSWLNLVWYEGEADLSAQLEELGCQQVQTALDYRERPLANSYRARSVLTAIGYRRTDVTVFLGTDESCLAGLGTLVGGLESGKYRVCAWRLGMQNP